MPVRLGVSPIGWSNDDLTELGGEIPLETCLAEARKAGFSGIELGNKLSRAVYSAHREGVAHGAINPRNIIMTQADAESRAHRDLQFKLLDLGVAAQMRPHAADAHSLQFMAPEQLALSELSKSPACHRPIPPSNAMLRAVACFLATSSNGADGRSITAAIRSCIQISCLQ